MELLKVFVSNGANTGSTVDTMVVGDILLLDASNYSTAISATTAAVVIAGKNSKGVYFSAPIKKNNIRYSSKVVDSTGTEAAASVAIDVGSAGSKGIFAGSTHTIGIQIKEDLRMGTYNKNTEVLSSYVLPSSGVPTTIAKDLSYSLVRGFTANPLTSAGSPYQLVNVKRTASNGTLAALGMAASVIAGARTVTATAHGRAIGDYVSLDGGIYQLEAVTTNTFTLDLGFQGKTQSLTSNAAGGLTQAAYFSAAPTTFGIKFDAIPQTQKNRYDQFRMVDFEVITPKGNELGLFTITSTKQVYPVGTYRQVRDLEEKAYTHSMPLINYREFPFEEFPIIAQPTSNNYDIFTTTFVVDNGYNYMQSNTAHFLQTVVICGIAGVGTEFDKDATNNNFAEFWTTFVGSGSTNDVFSDLTL